LSRKGKTYFFILLFLSLLLGRAFYVLFLAYLIYALIYYYSINKGLIKLKTYVDNYTLRQRDVLLLKFLFSLNFQIPFVFSISLRTPDYLVPASNRLNIEIFKARFDLQSEVLLKANRRGQYEIGEFDLSISDLFGLVHREQKIGDIKKIFVFPLLVPFERLKIHLSEPLEGLKAKYVLNPDYSYIAGARDYNENDPVSLIHWNQTAHRGRLTVKEFDFSASKRLIIVINLDSKSLKFQDYATSLAASICYYAQKFHLPFGVIINSKELIVTKIGRSDLHLMEIFKALSITGNEEVGLKEENFISKIVERIPFGAEVFYIDKTLSPYFKLKIMDLKKNASKLNIVLLPDETFLLPQENPPRYYFKEPYYFEVFGQSRDELAKEGIYIYQILGKDYYSIMEI